MHFKRHNFILTDSLVFDIVYNLQAFALNVELAHLCEALRTMPSM